MFVTLTYKWFARRFRACSLYFVALAFAASLTVGHAPAYADRGDDTAEANLFSKKLPGDAERGHAKVTARQLQNALDDYRNKRFNKAIPVLEKAAANRSFVARILLAHIYRTGKGGIVDHRQAYEYYREIASEFADSDSFYYRKVPYVAHAFVQLARYMEIGVKELDIKADPTSARILFEKAAHFGDLEGQYQLGRFLIESGRIRNVKLGQRWLTRAAKRNSAKAQAYLGALYWQGDLVQRKQALALAWIEFARRNATGRVKGHVERLHETVKFDSTEKQRAQAKIYIARLRTKYKVLWREAPPREPDENMFLDGIILADPPVGFAEGQEVRRDQGGRFVQDFQVDSDADEGSRGFGFQLFNFGNAGGN